MHKIDVPNCVAIRLPGWLHDVFITEVLKTYYTNPRVNDFAVVPLTNKYSVFRASFDFKANEFDGSRRTSFIVKQQSVADQIIMNGLTFNTEIDMYIQVIPKFEETLRKTGDTTVFAPRCIYHQYYPKHVIVLEDLTTLGYEVVRDRLLSINEVTAVLKKIAKWHAVSHKLSKENSNLFMGCIYGLRMAPHAFRAVITRNCFENFLNLLGRTPKLKIFKQFFEKLRYNYDIECIKSFVEYEIDPQPNIYYALNHGDFHAGNIMFKRNKKTGEVEDVKFIDFQTCYMAPMTNDLIFTMYQLLTPLERLHHRDKWIHVYFTEFQETLKKLDFNMPKPKLTEFRDQIMRYRSFEYYLLYSFLPVWYAQANGENTKLLLKTEEGRDKLFKNLDYINELQSLLPIYMMLGYFDMFE